MKRVKESLNLFEAELNLPQEYINRIRQEAQQQHGGFRGPTHQEMAQMGNLLRQIFQIQHGHEEELTELGKEVIQKFYGPIIEGVTLDVKIVDPNDEEKQEIAERMLEKNKQKEFEIENRQVELPGIQDDIDKRKLINNIMQGEAQNVHSMMYDMRDRVAEITGSNRLLDLYMQFLALNKKFDWDETQNLEMMVDEHPEMANVMEIKFKDDDDDDEEGGEGGEEGPSGPTIIARVLDLPMLVHETVKGIYELIAAGAIDPDEIRAKKVLDATDTLADEQRDIRYGPYIARDLRDYINSVADEIKGVYDIPNMREFVFGKMIKMPSKEFVELVTAILLKKEEPKKTIKMFIMETMDEIKDYKYRQAIDEPAEEPEDEPLPPGVEDFDDVEDEGKDEELRNLFNKPPKPKEEPKAEKSEADIRKWLSGLGLNALNVEMNKAIDNEDWPLAQEIQKMIERKTGGSKNESFVKESLNELFIPDEETDEEIPESEWYEKLMNFLTSEFGVMEDEAQSFIEFYADDFEDLYKSGSSPEFAAEEMVKKAQGLEAGDYSMDFDDLEDDERFPRYQREPEPPFEDEPLPDGVEDFPFDEK
jgi:hypothetical protein